MNSYIELKIVLNDENFYHLSLIKAYNKAGNICPYWVIDDTKIATLDMKNVRVELGWFYNSKRAISTLSCGYAFGQYTHKYFKNTTFSVECYNSNCPYYAEFRLILRFKKDNEIKMIKHFLKNLQVNNILNAIKKLGYWFKNAKNTKADIRIAIKKAISEHYGLALNTDGI